MDSRTSDWLEIFEERVDVRADFIPGAGFRRERKATYALIVHGFGDGDRGVVGNSVEELETFFLEDPEGVSTVTQSGSWADRKKTFVKWWKPEAVPKDWIGFGGIPLAEYRARVPTRIPTEFRKRAFVPYTFGIEGSRIVQWLPWNASGAHAVGWNQTAVSVAIIREIRSKDPLTKEQAISLSDLVTYCALRRSGIAVHTHDEANQIKGIRPKGCPGVDVSQPVRWGLLRAKNMMDSRRF